MKLCPYCDTKSNNEEFCDGCGRPIHEVKGETKKKDKEWRQSIKEDSNCYHNPNKTV